MTAGVEVLSPEGFAERLVAMAHQTDPSQRRIVALAGPPGAGKSTIAEMVVDRLGEDGALLPMDGYHFDDEILVPRGWRSRKGAPHTFDVGGLAAMIARLRSNEEDIAVPRFDRNLEITRAGAMIVPKRARVVLVEGLWLLYREPPWDRLHGCFDLTAMIEVEDEELRRRLRSRWLGHDMTEAQIAEKVDGNDLPNAMRVRDESFAADILIRFAPD